MSPCDTRRAQARRLRSLIVVLTLLVVTTMHAQVPAAGGVIIGRVVDIDSEEPIPGARVTVGDVAARRTMTGGADAYTVIADSQGRFYFSGLRPGLRSVSTLTTEANVADRPSAPVLVQLAANQVVRDVVVKSVQSAWLSGRVTDDVGHPIAGLSVVAFRRTGTGSQGAFVAMRSVMTDDRGDYTIDPLMPGEYLVCACRWMAPLSDAGLVATRELLGPSPRTAEVAVEVDAQWRPPVRTFYPAATHPGNASIITLRSNDARTNLHITVTSGRLATIAGRILGAPDVMAASAIRLQPVVQPGGPIIAGLEPSHVDADGSFRFTDVPHGQYVLSVRYRGPDPPNRGVNGLADRLGLLRRSGIAPPAPNDISHWTHTPVAVDGRDQLNLQIVLSEARRLSGRVRLSENGAVQSFRANGGRLEKLDEPVEEPPISSSVRADDDGSFELAGVIPGRYRFRWNVLPPGLTLKSIRFGGHDVTDLPFVIEDGPGPEFEVTLLPNDVGTIPGRLIADAAGFHQTVVVAFPADRRLWDEPSVAERRFLQAGADHLGQFRVEDVPPGDYIVAPIDAGERLREWRTLQRLEGLAATGKRITVVSGDNPPVEVRR